MPQDDYQPITAGTLKLKGVKPEKHKKKRKRDPSSSTAKNDVNGKTIVHEGGDVDARNEGKEEENGRRFKREKAIDKVLAEEEASKGEAQEDDDGENAQGAGKTEAERRHDERRRKRLDERLKREGIKTHKERVEELNRYLSNLSEHHDMPRIGPG